jgi:hypothetical protein
MRRKTDPSPPSPPRLMARIGSRTAIRLCALALVSVAPDMARAQRPVNDTLPRRSCASPRPLLLRRSERDSVIHCIAQLELYADGNIKDVLGTSKTKPAINGALGLKFIGNRFEATGLVNIAGTVDTVRRGYGASMLTPGTGHGLNAALLEVIMSRREWRDPACAMYSYPLACNIRLRLQLSASTKRWLTAQGKLAPPVGKTDSVDFIETRDVPIWGADVGVSYKFVDEAIAISDSVKQTASMILDIGYSHRALRGDISGDSTTVIALRNTLLGTRNIDYPGLSVGITLTYGMLRSQFTYMRLRGAANGLSRGQVVATAEIRAPLASGALKRK